LKFFNKCEENKIGDGQIEGVSKVQRSANFWKGGGVMAFNGLLTAIKKDLIRPVLGITAKLLCLYKYHEYYGFYSYRCNYGNKAIQRIVLQQSK
jgi:hypothetical protein